MIYGPFSTIGKTGGEVYAAGGSPAVAGTTIAGNTADSLGGGIVCTGGGSATVTSSIVWGNAAPVAPEIAALFSSTLTIGYCDVAGGEQAAAVWGESTLNWEDGNADADPLFADADNGDYHLRSRYGRWSALLNDGAGGWADDDATSPCTDAGDPGADFSNEPMPNFGRTNMGAFGNTAEASKSGWNVPGDVNDDCSVNVLDLLGARNNLKSDAGTGRNWKYDVNSDGSINVLDLISVRNKLRTSCN